MVTTGGDSPESGFLVETVQSDADTASLVSGGASEGSATLDFPDGVTFHDLVDLTHEGLCRVLMRGDRGKPPRVCGTPAVECRQANHAAKRSEGRVVSSGGWYVRYGTKNGYPDGREDLGRIPEEEVAQLKDQALARDKADLEAFLPPPEEVVFEGKEERETEGRKEEPSGEAPGGGKPEARGGLRRSTRLQPEAPHLLPEGEGDRKRPRLR